MFFLNGGTPERRASCGLRHNQERGFAFTAIVRRLFLPYLFAGSCALAFEQMSLMIRETGAGGGLRMDEIKWLLSVVVDVIVQFDRDERGRFISEILYEPRRQRLGRWDQQAAAA